MKNNRYGQTFKFLLHCAIVACAGMLFALIISAHGCKPYEKDTKKDRFAQIMMAEDSRRPEPLLKELAKDKDPAIRQRVAIAAGRIANPELLEVLKQLLKDEYAGIRASACFAIGIMGESGNAEFLAPLLDDENPAVRGAAADAICRLKSDKLGTRVAAKLDDKDGNVVKKTLLSIWKLKGTTIIDRVIELSRAEENDLRWKAAYCLMRLSAPRSFDRLSELSRDGSPLIRSLVARGLEKIDNPGAPGVLIDLCYDQDWKVAVTALRSIRAKGKMVKQDSIAPLLSNDNEHIVLAAIESIPLLEGDKTESLLGKYLGAKEPRYRIAAVSAFAKAPIEIFLKTGEKMIRDDDWRVRAALAEGLANFEDTRVFPPILKLINDNDERVVPFAITALMKQKPENPIASVNHLFLKNDLVIRATAILEVSNLLWEESKDAKKKRNYGKELKDTFLDVLVASYDIAHSDADCDAKIEILNAASKFYGNPAAGELISSALNDSDYLVRKRASDILASPAPADSSAVPTGLMNQKPGSDKVLPAVTGRDVNFYKSALDRLEKVKGAVIKTEKGDIQIRFFPEAAPLTVKNFCDLSENGFYNGKNFHRVVSNFVIQDGCPRGDGSGGPGYRIRCELNTLDYEEGSVGMALSGKDTGGSQFFITHAPQPHLTGNYTLFGKVASGMDVVDRILVGDKILSVEIMK